MMKRAVVFGNNPTNEDYHKRDPGSVFEDVGSNTGNQAITFGVACQLSRSATFLPWSATTEEIRSAGDILIFPMANQLGPHTDLGPLAERIDEIDLPVLGVGLGAQSPSDAEDIWLKPGTMKWLETIARRAPGDTANIGVRGSYTRAQLAKLGFPMASLITGCPSNFMNTSRNISDRVADGFKRKPRHIAVSAGIPYISALENIEQDLIDMVTLTGGAYIVQHGINMIQIARNEFDQMTPRDLEDCRRYMMPMRSMGEFKAWCRQFAYAIFDSVAWLDFVRRFDFVVGTRFHGAMYAIQAGVPAACIAHDSRTLEMCQTMGIPVRHYEEIPGSLTQHNILDYFTFNAEKYDSARQNLHANFMKIYDAAEVEINPGFRHMYS